jgi:hypothetical protein
LPGPVSNGEYLPAPAGACHHRIVAQTMARATDAARRVGMDRRRFLQSAGGMAVLLSVLDAGCGRSTGGRGRAVKGGRYHVPVPEDLPACAQALGNQGEFIFDGHTHHVMPAEPWAHTAPETVSLVLGMLPAGCAEANPLDCVNRAAYVHDMFVASDTTVALLSDVPNSGPATAALPFTDALGTQEMVDQLTQGGASRVILHDVVAPNFGALGPHLDAMSADSESGRVAAFKVYTAWGPEGRGFALDDPSIGLPVVQHAHDLGIKVMCGHKGLPLMRFDLSHNGPRDMVAVAKQFPGMQFVVFHSAWDPGHREGPYDPANATTGVDSLLKALDDYGVAPNANVWADLGTTWRVVLSEPDQAAHVVGKLLKRVGEDRVLWGTDAVWYGSPQPQIMAFRAFEIAPAYQEAYGYPALTDDVKRKVFGLNGAQLFGLDPEATRCALAHDVVATAKAEHAELVNHMAVPPPWQPRGPITRRQVVDWLARARSPWTPA